MKDEVFGAYFLTKQPATLSFVLPPSYFPLVPLAVPFWNGATYRAILRSLLSGTIIDGPDLGALKSSLINRLRVADAVLCGSGSLALELALRACGIGKSDEVIIPAFCCSAIVPPVLALGALPVLADIGAELNLTVETVAAAITRKTKAIIVPHLFGNPADISAIVELARARNIRVIDDAAQAFGATVDGRAVGTFGDVGVLSFGHEKVCAGFGGGALVRNCKELLDDGAPNLSKPRPSRVMAQLASIEFWQRRRHWTLPLQNALQHAERPGPDIAPMPYGRESVANLQAAVALSLVHTLDENIAARRARAKVYTELLGDVPGLMLIAHRAGSARLTQVVRVRSKRRGHDAASALIATLCGHGFEVQGSYVPIHLLGCFKRCVWDTLPRTGRVWADLVELPCAPGVSLDHVQRIASIVKAFCCANGPLLSVSQQDSCLDQV